MIKRNIEEFSTANHQGKIVKKNLKKLTQEVGKCGFEVVFTKKESEITAGGCHGRSNQLVKCHYSVLLLLRMMGWKSTRA